MRQRGRREKKGKKPSPKTPLFQGMSRNTGERGKKRKKRGGRTSANDVCLPLEVSSRSGGPQGKIEGAGEEPSRPASLRRRSGRGGEKGKGGGRGREIISYLLLESKR